MTIAPSTARVGGPTQAGPGVLVGRGVTVRIPPGGFVIRETPVGTSVDPVRVELRLDTCIHWLEIALDNLGAARSAHDDLLLAKASGSADLLAPLNREFKASVQAAVAAATFFEALYAATLERSPPPSAPPAKPTARRTARYALVTEQLRRSFGLRKQGTANLRSVLKETYRFRDEAVHPSARFADPVLHPQLEVGVERRFAMFSFASAKQLVRAALAFSKILPSRELGRRPEGIQQFAKYLLEVCDPLYPRWEVSYGTLLDTPPDAG